MLVCAHGDVAEFCREHDFTVAGQYIGNITDYDGDIKMIVTDKEMSKQEFYYLRLVMLGKGYDVRSIHYPCMDKELNEFLEYVGIQERNRRKETYGGRQPFGYQKRNGVVVENSAMMYVARRIIELRDSGMKLRDIREFPEIHHPDGRKISISTIQQIINNRERYEK